MFPQWNQAFQGVDPNVQSQQMYWQQYYGYQQSPQAMWGAMNATATPGYGQTIPPQQGQGAQAASTATLPPEPPKEEAPAPPLPADPPPPPAPEAKPPSDADEHQKLSVLQQQAAQWQQQKQWQEYQQSMLQYQQQLQQWNAQQASILDQISQEEKDFELQYADWMKQYNDWKEQNKNHPNKDQYLQYEQQWKQYEEQMSQKRDYIKQRKNQALMNIQLAQTSGTHMSTGGMMDLGVSSAPTKPPEPKQESVSATPRYTSSFSGAGGGGGGESGSGGAGSGGSGGGMIYTSAGVQSISVCPPVSHNPYGNYGYGSSNLGVPQQPADQSYPPSSSGPVMWQHQQPLKPDPPPVLPMPPQSFDSSLNQPVSTSVFGMGHSAPSGDFRMPPLSGYGGQGQLPPSVAAPTEFWQQPQQQQPAQQVVPQYETHMRQQAPHLPYDPNAVKSSAAPPSFLASAEGQSYGQKMDVFGSSSADNSDFSQETHAQNTGLQQQFPKPQDMNATRFPVPRPPGMPLGMHDSNGRNFEQPGIRMPQESRFNFPQGSSFTPPFGTPGQRMENSERGMRFPGAPGLGNARPPHESEMPHFGAPQPTGPNAGEQPDFEWQPFGHNGQRMPNVSQVEQFSRPTGSEQNKSLESAPRFFGMERSRMPHNASNPETNLSRFSGPLGSRSSNQPQDMRFSGPRMSNEYRGQEPSHFETQPESSPDGFQQSSTGARFPGPRGPGMRPDVRQTFGFGEFRFPGMRPDNGQFNSGNRFSQPLGPGFQQDHGFSDPRIPGPRGPGMGQSNQQNISGGPRFMGTEGPTVGEDRKQDAHSGDLRFSGPRGGPNIRPGFNNMETFPTFPRGPRGPDFRQEPRPVTMQGNRGPSNMDMGPDRNIRFSGNYPQTSGPRPFSGHTNFQSSPVQNSLPTESLTGGVPNKSETCTPTVQDQSKKPEPKDEGKQESGNSTKSQETANKSFGDLSKNSTPQGQKDSFLVSVSGAGVQPSSAAKNFDSPGQNKLPLSAPHRMDSLNQSAIAVNPLGCNVRQEAPPSLMQLNVEPVSRGARPFGPRPGVPPSRFTDAPIRPSGPALESDMRFTKWQAPTGMESDAFEYDEADMGDNLTGEFQPRGRGVVVGGPRFPAPVPRPGAPGGMRPPFPRGPDLQFRPRMAAAPGVTQIPPGMQARCEPVEDFTENDVGEHILEFGTDGEFGGKRKVDEIHHEPLTEESYEAAAMPPASKFGRLDPGVRPPPPTMPRMPTGRGFDSRLPFLDAGNTRFGGPAGMRPRFDPGNGRMMRPQRGPVPLMQLNVYRPGAVMDKPVSEEAEYHEEEFAEEQHEEVLAMEFGRFPNSGPPRGPSSIREPFSGSPRMGLGPRGPNAIRLPRPPMEGFHPRMERGGGPNNMRAPFGVRGGGPSGPFGARFGNPQIGFREGAKEEFVEESYDAFEQQEKAFDEDRNAAKWGAEDRYQEGDANDTYDNSEISGQVDSDGAAIQFSEREHELIKKAAEELKLLRQKQDQLDVLSSLAPVLDKPKPPMTSLVPYGSDEAQEEPDDVLRYQDKNEYFDRDDRGLRGRERPMRDMLDHFLDEPRFREEGFGVDPPFGPEPFRERWLEDGLPRRPIPPDFDYRVPSREFEPPWDDDEPGFREGRFPRRMDEFNFDRRPFDNRRGPPPDWGRITPPPLPIERGPRGLPLPPLPNPREFLDNLENRSRPPSFGRGHPPFEGLPPIPSAVFDYGHGGRRGDGFGHRQQNAEREEYRHDRDTRFQELEVDRDMRQERFFGPGAECDQDDRLPYPGDMNERGGWLESRDPEFPGSSFERERGGRGKGYDNRSSLERGGREPLHWNRDYLPDRERDIPDRDEELWDRDRHPDRDICRERGGMPGEFEDPFFHQPKQGPPGPTIMEEAKSEVAAVDDILLPPGRRSRPDHIVVIIRGLPGAGKTFVSRLIKDKEIANGGTAPRMLCLDDYFMTETEKMIEDPETGKKTKKMVMEYEYDQALEPSYKVSFLKSFKRQIDDCYFNFIIVDAIFDKIDYLDEFWSYAKSKGFQVYIAEMQADISTCAKRNTHQRKQADIQKIADGWDEMSRHYIRLDVRSLLQDAAIEDVEMVDTMADDASIIRIDEKNTNDETEEDIGTGLKKSKWEMDTSEQQLDKLDGIRAAMKKHEIVPQRLEDYLQLPDDYDTRKSEPGKKRVRWADIEERKSQMRRRELGFVVGQTDWAKMTDDSYADRALNRTKYF